MKRYPVYRSAVARLSRSVGAIALPVALLAVLVHRVGGLTADQMVLAILAATVIGLAAVFLSATAFAQLWRRGGRGAMDAALGTLYGLIALLPAGALAASQVLQGSPMDISTNEQDPPTLTRAQNETLIPLLADLGPVSLKEDFSDIVSRRYRIQPAVLHLAALTAAERNGWRVVSEVPPDLLDAPTSFQAEVKTPILGLVDDVAVRIRPDPAGSLFDVRSASRYPLQDLGGNAARIRGFYRDMDEVLLETYGDVETLTVLEGETPDDTAVLEAPESASGEEVIPVPAFKPYFEGADDIVAEDLIPGEDG
ncbi:DUF1499 domain-containing protein [Roseibium sp.]|uniref:DUF1499 domain-containing protein n=1 Tax=Roseibium sp. TaxID=1936156 RepID=UPI003A9836B3